MPHITLSEEQAKVLLETSTSVEMRDPAGHLLAVVTPKDRVLAQTIEECKHRLASKAPRIPAERVAALLQRCQEIDQSEGMTREKMADLCRRVKAGEAP